MITLLARWNGIIDSLTTDMNKQIARFAKASAEQWDACEYQHLLEQRQTLAAYTYHRSGLEEVLARETNLPTIVSRIKDNIERDIMKSLTGRVSMPYKKALIEMRHNLDMPIMWQEDRVKA